jgi:diguanylate cyclase (GGDEF)-like protein
LASSRERLWFQATHDNLTGILSRGYFVERAEDAIRRALRYREPLSLINLDIDYFKLINDRFGHQSGDDTLKALTATCATCLREVDLFGRLGGEEFCILLPQTDTDGAMHVAERIRESVASQSGDHGNEHLKITVSLGVAAFFESDRNFDPLYARADRALYRAKQNGRNRVELDISEDSRGL